MRPGECVWYGRKCLVITNPEILKIFISLNNVLYRFSSIYQKAASRIILRILVELI